MGVAVVAAVFVDATAVFVAEITMCEGVSDDDGTFDAVELIEGSVGTSVTVSFGSAQATLIDPKSMKSRNSKRRPRPQRFEWIIRYCERPTYCSSMRIVLIKSPGTSGF